MNNVIDYKDVFVRKTEKILELIELDEDCPERLCEQRVLLGQWLIKGSVQNEETC